MSRQSGYQLFDNQGRGYPLTCSSNSLGRASTNAIVINDAQASRVHAVIFIQNGQLYLRDEHSTNGTFLNGTRIAHAAALKVGDRIRVGGSEFVVQLAAPEQRRAPVLPIQPEYTAPRSQSSVLPIVIFSMIAMVLIFLIVVVVALGQNPPVSAPTLVVHIPTVIPPTVSAPTSAPIPTATPIPTSPSLTPAPTVVPSATSVPQPTATVTSEPVHSYPLPPPLADVDFPTQVIPYPSDWPAELHYPDQFQLVAVSSGFLPQGGTKAWGGKLSYTGSLENAKASLVAFLTSQGWKIIELSPVGNQGWHLFVQRGTMPQIGVVLFGSDLSRPGIVKVLATIFL